MDGLPLRIQAKILGNLDLPDSQRHILRRVCSTWLHILDSTHFVHLRLKNQNYDQFMAVTPLGNGFTWMTRKGYVIHLIDLFREFTMSPSMVPFVRRATFINQFAHYNLHDVLEQCVNLETLVLNLTSKKWSNETLRPQMTLSRPLTLPRLKTLHIDIDSSESFGPDQPIFVKEFCFLAYLGSGDFDFLGLETLTFGHRDSGMYRFMRDRFPPSLRPDAARIGEFVDPRWARVAQAERQLLLLDEARQIVSDPGLFCQPPPPPEADVRGQRTSHFLKLLSKTPNLKALSLGFCQAPFFQIIAQEENHGLVQGIKDKLTEVTISPLQSPYNYISDGGFWLRVNRRNYYFHDRDLRPIPKFLGVTTCLKSMDLSFGVKGMELEFLYQLLEKNQTTLERLNLTFILESLQLNPEPLDLALDLAHFSVLSKLTFLVLHVTNSMRDEYSDSLVNTALLPGTLKVFKTNIQFTQENLAGMAQSLTNLEMMMIHEYVGEGRGQGQGTILPGKLQRDLLNNNPRMVICSIQPPEWARDPEEYGYVRPREPRMESYPTIPMDPARAHVLF